MVFLTLYLRNKVLIEFILGKFLFLLSTYRTLSQFDHYKKIINNFKEQEIGDSSKPINCLGFEHKKDFERHFIH